MLCVRTFYNCSSSLTNKAQGVGFPLPYLELSSILKREYELSSLDKHTPGIYRAKKKCEVTLRIIKFHPQLCLSLIRLYILDILISVSLTDFLNIIGLEIFAKNLFS